MKEGLKPCPFCGADADIRDVCIEDETGEVNGFIRVSCSNDECRSKVVCEVHADTEFEASDSWNRRAVSACEPAARPSLGEEEDAKNDPARKA